MARPSTSRIPFSPLYALLKMVVRNGGVQLSQLHHLLTLLVRYTAVEPLRLVERFVFDRKIAAHQLPKDPIFVIGHWRSGTSYLQTVLSQDPSLATSTLYRSIFADIFYVSESWLKPIFNRLAHLLRLPFSLQRQPLHLDIPAEGDVALCSLLSPYSYTWGHIFPTRFGVWMDRCVFNPPPPVAAGWLEHYDTFVRKLSLASGGRQLVMKSPGDTARVALLLRQYPDARFVYIHRDPVAVFHSNTYFWSVIHREFALQKLTPEDVQAVVLDTYESMVEGYLSQREQIPASQRVEVRYEDLLRDPMATIEVVYRGLGKGVVPDEIQAYLSQQKPYGPNTVATSPAQDAMIRQRWAQSFRVWPPRACEKREGEAPKPEPLG